MKKSKLLALFLGSLMIGSCLLSSCNNATASGSPWKDDETSSSQKPNSGSNLDKTPVQDTVTGPTASTYLTEDNADLSAMTAAYYKQQEEAALAAKGIGKDDYVWTIVTLKGDGLIDRYENANGSGSIAEYAEDGGKSYRDNMLSEQNNIKRQIYNYDTSAEFSYSYTLVSNGFAAKVKYGDLDKLRSIVGIESIVISEQYEPETDSEDVLDAADDSDVGQIAAEENSDEERPGEGAFIAILDTALAVQNSAFSGDRIDMSKAKATQVSVASALSSTGAFYVTNSIYNKSLSISDVYYNNKVIFGYDYGNYDTDITPAAGFEDALCHGTHVAGIAAGDSQEDGFTGVAPYAQLAFMKVFTDNANADVVYASDVSIASALEDCILLGVDAINMSLGSTFGFSVDSREENYIYQYCYYADLLGINVQVSVGNGYNGYMDGISGDYPLASNPDYGMVDMPASFESTLAVGSYNGTNVAQYYVSVDGKNAYYNEVESGMFVSELGEGTYDWVYVGDKTSYAELAAANVNGKIVLVDGSSRDQMLNAYRAGAKAIIFVDDSYRLDKTVAFTLTERLPYCNMPLAQAEKFISLGSGKMTVSASQKTYNLMSSFSAWGTTSTLNIKPELVAIGSNVYSTIDPENYGYMSGTSMSAPKATAYAARLKKALRDKYPSKSDTEIAKLVKQILMSTATQLTDENGVAYSPRYQGAGAVNYAAALNTPAYISVVGTDKTKIELGEDEDKTGVYVLNFNVNNMSDGSLTYTISVEAMTQALCGDGKTVSLLGYVLQNCATNVTVRSASYDKATNQLTIGANASASVAIQLSLSAEAKKYIDDNFANGSYVEGYVTLASDAACDLSVPFLAFYGDWEEAPVLDGTIFDDEEALLYATELVGKYSDVESYTVLGQYQYDDPQGSYTLYVNDQEVSGVAKEYDENRLSIGSKSGGYAALSELHLSLLRNADVVELTITDAQTGEQYYTTQQAQAYKNSTEDTVEMATTVIAVDYGSSALNNTYLRLTVRAILNGASDEQNSDNELSLIVAVDSEAPKMYSDADIYKGVDGRVYLVANIYDNNILNNIWLYTYDDNGNAVALDAPLAIDTSAWNRGATNSVRIDITDYLAGCDSETIGVALEDASMNRSAYKLTIPTGVLSDEAEDEKTVTAESITYDKDSNLAVGYSTDLNISTKPANASYTLEIVEMADSKYCGKAEIDAERNLIIAKEAGYVRVRIASGATTAEADVYIYALKDEFAYELVTDEIAAKVNGLKDFKYDPSNPDEKYYILSAYQGTGTHVEIPSAYVDEKGNSYTVVAIGNAAFYASDTLCRVTVPDSVRVIGANAFESCDRLTNVVFGENSALASIGERAFYLCSALKNVTLPSNGALQTIGSEAFVGTAIEEITLPNTLTAIGNAFVGTPLKSLTIPASVTSGVLLTDCASLEEVTLPNGMTAIEEAAFKNCVSLKKIAIPATVQTIGANAFYGCSLLTSVTIPDGVQTIGNAAFGACSRLVNVRLGNGVTTLGDEVFINDTSLRSIYFAEETNIQTWGSDIFSGCYSFSEYTVNRANTNLLSDDGILYVKVNGGYELFAVPQGKAVTSLLLRTDVVSIGEKAFYDHGELTSVLISEGGSLSYIGDYAFAACTSLTVVSLENVTSLKTIGKYAFAYCTALTSVRLPEGLETIEEGAFYYDVYLARLIFSDSITSIGDLAFAYCIRLKGTNTDGTLVLPKSLTEMGEAAFYANRLLLKVDMSACENFVGDTEQGYQFTNCYTLKEVILPASLEEIGQYMFTNCTALTKINLTDTYLDSIGSYSFAYCEALTDLTFPETLNNIGAYAFLRSGITSANLPKYMGGKIMTAAFAMCENLTEVSLPLNVKELPDYAFAGTAIEEIYIPANFTTIASNAFSECYNLTKFTVSEKNPAYGATEEGILYTITTKDQTETYGLYILPLKLQAKELTIDEKFTSIPSAFFYGSTSIEKVYIPATVTSIGMGAFYESKVQEVEFAADSELYLTTDNYALFQNCTELRKVILPQYFSYVPHYMFSGCTSLESVTLPSTVTAIAAYAFENCTSLKSIDLSNIQLIGYGAFVNCTSLQTISINTDLTALYTDDEGSVFDGCTSLTEITVAEGNLTYKSVDGVLFDKTGSVLYLYPAAKAGSEYAVPQGVTKISAYAFANNKNLEKIVLPKTLCVVGNAAFYQTEKLHKYVFLSETAPRLEGIYSSEKNLVLYSNFYDVYTNDFASFGLYAAAPDDSTGYDTWLYEYFFNEVTSLSAESAYTKPTEMPIPSVTETITGTDETAKDYKALFAAYVAELLTDTDLDKTTKDKLNALTEEFNADQDAFASIIQSQPAFGEKLYENYIAEAESICASKTNIEAYRYQKVAALNELIAECLSTKTYSSAYQSELLTFSYYIVDALDDATTIDEIDQYYDYYYALIEGIPAASETTSFSNYCQQQAAALKASYDAIKQSDYDDDVYAYLTTQYNSYYSTVSSAASKGQVTNAINNWNSLLQNVVKKADKAAFEQAKADYIALLRSYDPEDYVYYYRTSIRSYVDRQVGYIEQSYSLAAIELIVEYTVSELESLPTVLSTQKSTARSNIETAVETYAMYSNLFAEEASVLRAIVEQVLSEIDQATTVEEVRQIEEEGSCRIWAYYEYNQKAYTVYRRALEAFASLTGEKKEEAMNALESISYRVASNYSAIQALIDYYCADENV